MIYSIGKHTVRHGDLLSGISELSSCLPAGGVDYVYSDPPWGNFGYWHTLNAKQNSDLPAQSFHKAPNAEEFLSAFYGVVKSSTHSGSIVWVEYGLRWRELVKKKAEEIGLSMLALSFPKYGGKSISLALFTFAYRTDLVLPDGYGEGINKTKGFKTLEAATGGAWAGLAPGKTLLDPCCGLGYSARLAVKHGMTFYGNELNKKRLASTMQILEKDSHK